MKMRHILLLFSMAVELFLFLYCLIRKTNHVPAGYLCSVLSFLLLIATGWLLLFPKSTPVETTGRYTVSREDSFYTDPNRLESYAGDGSHRELSVSFWYPQDCEAGHTCPLVLFSHGSFGVKESNESLYRELASHGYVVCAVDHTYQCFSTKQSNGKTVRVSGEFMKEIADSDFHKNPQQAIAYAQKWMDIRTGDLNFVLDTILSKIRVDDIQLSVYRRINPEKIAVAGHSLGGSAALGVGRQREDISAVVSLDAPFLCDMQEVCNDGTIRFDESPYPVPVLNVYSDASWEHLTEWKQYAENARLLEEQSDIAQNVYLSGIGHFSLTDFSLTSPFLTMVFDGQSPKEKPQETLKKLNQICLSFLDKHLH